MRMSSRVTGWGMRFVAFLVIWGLQASAWSADATLNEEQRVQFLNAAIHEAHAKTQAGEPAQAKFSLLAVLTFVREFAPRAEQPPFNELLGAYMVVRNEAWKAGPEMSDATVNAFFAFWDENQAEFNRLAGVYRWQNMPDGVNEYRRKVTQMINEYKASRELAAALSALAPPPDLILQNQQLYTRIFRAQIFDCLYRIHFGPSMAAQMALTRVIPDAQKEVLARIEKAKQLNDPPMIWVELGQAKEQHDMLVSIEAAFREELPQAELQAALPVLLESMEAENQRAIEIMDKRIDENRMPSDTWKAADRDAVVEAVREAYANAYPEETILRISLQSNDAFEQWESFWTGDRLVTQYAGYIQAAVAVKQKSGNHRVFFKRLRKVRQSGGRWSPYAVASTITSYRIRPENIDK